MGVYAKVFTIVNERNPVYRVHLEGFPGYALLAYVPSLACIVRNGAYIAPARTVALAERILARMVLGSHSVERVERVTSDMLDDHEFAVWESYQRLGL